MVGSLLEEDTENGVGGMVTLYQSKDSLQCYIFCINLSSLVTLPLETETNKPTTDLKLMNASKGSL